MKEQFKHLQNESITSAFTKYLEGQTVCVKSQDRFLNNWYEISGFEIIKENNICKVSYRLTGTNRRSFFQPDYACFTYEELSQLLNRLDLFPDYGVGEKLFPSLFTELQERISVIRQLLTDYPLDLPVTLGDFVEEIPTCQEVQHG
ncbi:MAG: hypothetical protein JXR56_03130 [Candidatus Cloacimonetes bacterium]|nr:hypothetical protein [Candidatus Cloacimonadota bacterium]